MAQVRFGLWVANRKTYRAYKQWLAPDARAMRSGRDQVAYLMRTLEIRGVSRRRRRVGCTVADPGAARAPDLIKRRFTADRPDALWVTDLSRWGRDYIVVVQDALNARPRRTLNRPGPRRVARPTGAPRRPGAISSSYTRPDRSLAESRAFRRGSVDQQRSSVRPQDGGQPTMYTP